MDVQLKPELERFVEQQVRDGHFASRAEVLEAGLARLILDPPQEQISDDEAAALRRSLDQMRRGEVVDWRQFSASWRTKYGTQQVHGVIPSYRVNLTLQVADQLEEIHRYIEQDSPQNAAKTIGRILREIDSVASSDTALPASTDMRRSGAIPATKCYCALRRPQAPTARRS